MRDTQFVRWHLGCWICNKNDQFLETKTPTGPYDYFPTYTYGNVTCKKGYHPLLGLTDFASTNPELVGMKTNQLPVSSTNVFYGPYPEYNYTETYEYVFDAEGYISQIKVKFIASSQDSSNYTYYLTWK